MQLIQDNDIIFNNTCITFGYFNSLHKGHRSVISRLIEQESKGFNSLLLCLEKDQRIVTDTKCDIYTMDEKFRILQKNGPMLMVSYPFAEVIESMEPEEFIKEILVGRLDAKVIVAGNNCRFGKHGDGNIQTLKKLSDKYGYELVSCETVKYEEKSITDDWINHEIIEGDIETANTLLGSPFTLWGSVIHGKALGRKFGMPTANLRLPENKIIPKHGVYATMSNIDGKWIKGLTNIGRRPSVDDHTHVSVETYLLDFSGDIYGKEVSLELHHYIRGVKKFNNLEEVTQQVKLDVIVANNMLLT
ncbi:MAG: bifunctional riboflavin kinase/FAD synthetase [Dethiosulfatibacter sp.]|nr:bifunctional riboflavin kinase/FAD synthetase [Dethiosulfatibacter sp.]